MLWRARAYRVYAYSNPLCIKRLFFAIAVVLFSGLIVPCSAQEETRSPAGDDLSFLAQHGDKVLVVECLLGALLVADQATRVAILKQLEPLNALRTFCKEYATFALANFAHESGHALMALMIHGDPIDIHVGAEQPSQQPLISFSGVTVEGLHPNRGWTVYGKQVAKNQALVDRYVEEILAQLSQEHTPLKNLSYDELCALVRQHCYKGEKDGALCSSPYKPDQSSAPKNRGKRLAVLVAGGLGGCASQLILASLLILVQRRLSVGSPYLELIGHSCWGATTAAVTGKQLSSIVMPYGFNGGKSDGYALLHEVVGIPVTVLDRIAPWVPLTDLAAEIAVLVTYRDRSRAINPLVVCLLAVVNYYLEGFFRFSL